MKKTILILSLAAFFYSCGGGSNDGGGEKKTAADNPDIEKGLELVGKSNCLGCHKVNETNIGPAYNEIGKKYENTEANINMLAEKIQKGGSGNWGTVPMAGHSEISTADAKLMVKYVLSLKDEK